MSISNDSGAITPGGRFERMEAALVRIEEQLDQKADMKTLERHGQLIERLDSRMDSVEQWKRDREQEAEFVERQHIRRLTKGQKIVAGVASAALFIATFLGPYLGNHLHL
jgi:hypothetical protein